MHVPLCFTVDTVMVISTITKITEHFPLILAWCLGQQKPDSMLVPCPTDLRLTLSSRSTLQSQITMTTAHPSQHGVYFSLASITFKQHSHNKTSNSLFSLTPRRLTPEPIRLHVHFKHARSFKDSTVSVVLELFHLRWVHGSRLTFHALMTVYSSGSIK